MKLLIGIDDTDNKDTRGTGYRARELASLLEEQELARVSGITRHQLFFDPRIPYTSQNSSAALVVDSDRCDELKSFCRSHMQRIGAVGSDVGLCIAPWDAITDDIMDWGRRAKCEVLTMDDARALASLRGVYLEGLTGTEVGIIGALAATGLRKSGHDGRFIWLNGPKDLRDLKAGTYNMADFGHRYGIDVFCDKQGSAIDPVNKSLLTHEWLRPALRNSCVTLIVEPIENRQNNEWQTAPKAYLKSLTQ